MLPLDKEATHEIWMPKKHPPRNMQELRLIDKALERATSMRNKAV